MSSDRVTDSLLVNDWHVVGRSSELSEASLGSARLLGEDVVLWRAAGEARAWQDLCIHGGSKLSLGRVSRRALTCAYQDSITGQDIPIVESQRPERLPLDLQAEMHLRSDRTAAAYRRWLKQVGLTFGTS